MFSYVTRITTITTANETKIVKNTRNEKARNVEKWFDDFFIIFFIFFFFFVLFVLCLGQKSSTTTQYRSLYENYTSCVWNVSLASPYGCVVETSLGTNKPTSMPTEPIIIDSHKHHKLSTGSVFVIM